MTFVICWNVAIQKTSHHPPGLALVELLGLDIWLDRPIKAQVFCTLGSFDTIWCGSGRFQR
ncbi:protein of unknown function [Magnetospirillum sp. XM-1]|nr:protein of unknown function [Magnetospirillum sp. XM-1]